MDDIVEVKKVIRSILTSTPNKMTVHRLNIDYQEIIGRPIPYKILGYATLEEFVYSVPDTIKVLGSGLHAEVVPVLNKSSLSSEINRLVCLQRNTKKAPRFSRYKPIRQPRPRRQEVYFIQTQPKNIDLLKKNTHPARQDVPKQMSSNVKKELAPNIKPPESKKRIYSSKNNCDSLNNVITKIEQVKLTQPENVHTEVVTKKRYFKETRDFSDSFEDESGASANYFSEKENCDTIACDLFSEQFKNYRVPLKVQDNLAKLIKDYPDGLWCGRLPDIYKLMFCSELNYQKYGYKSLAQMCAELSHIFQCIQPGKGDFKLYHKSKKLTENDVISSSQMIRKTQVIVDSCQETLPCVDDLLEKVLDLCYPPETVKLYEELERQWIDESLNVLEYIDIIVSEIYDPSKFWIIVISNYCSIALDDMMNELQDFYNQHGPCLEIKNSKLLRIGLYCITLFQNEFHRAIIVNTLEDQPGFIKVFYIDYGTVDTVPLKKLYFLHRQFFILPAQAIRARLSGVKPPKMNSPWSPEATKLFFDLVTRKQLVAQIASINLEKKYLDLYICDTTTEDDIYVHDCLIKDGLAISLAQKQEVYTPKLSPVVKYIHLYPTFEEIEQGLVPSSEDMLYFYSRQMSHSLILPQYYVNPVYEDCSHKVKNNYITKDQKFDLNNTSYSKASNVSHTSELHSDSGSTSTDVTISRETTSTVDHHIKSNHPYTKCPPGFEKCLPAPGWNLMQQPVMRNTTDFQHFNYQQQCSYPMTTYLNQRGPYYQNPQYNYMCYSFNPNHVNYKVETYPNINNSYLYDNRPYLRPLNQPYLYSNMNANEVKVHEESETKLVSTYELAGKNITILKYDGANHTIVDEITSQFFGQTIPINKIRKMVALSNLSITIEIINFIEEARMKAELIRYNGKYRNCDSLHVIRIEFIPKLFEILGASNCKIPGFNNFVKNLQHV